VRDHKFEDIRKSILKSLAGRNAPTTGNP